MDNLILLFANYYAVITVIHLSLYTHLTYPTNIDLIIGSSYQSENFDKNISIMQ